MKKKEFFAQYGPTLDALWKDQVKVVPSRRERNQIWRQFQRISGEAVLENDDRAYQALRPVLDRRRKQVRAAEMQAYHREQKIIAQFETQDPLRKLRHHTKFLPGGQRQQTFILPDRIVTRVLGKDGRIVKLHVDYHDEKKLK